MKFNHIATLDNKTKKYFDENLICHDYILQRIFIHGTIADNTYEKIQNSRVPILLEGNHLKVVSLKETYQIDSEEDEAHPWEIYGENYILDCPNQR